MKSFLNLKGVMDAQTDLRVRVRFNQFFLGRIALCAKIHLVDIVF